MGLMAKAKAVHKSKPKISKPVKKKTSKTSIDIKKGRYETDIDAFYRLVRDKKSVGLSEAAGIFRVGENVIEEWAKILEEHGMIEMHYPLFGSRALLKIKELKKKKK